MKEFMFGRCLVENGEREVGEGIVKNLSGVGFVDKKLAVILFLEKCLSLQPIIQK